MKFFSKELTIRWSDLDPNFHVKHTSYADFCATARMQYLEQEGFGMQWMTKNRIGPVILNEELTYKAELRAMDRVRVDVYFSGLSEDGRKWEISHKLWRQDETLVADVRVFGVWFDLVKRKATTAPEDLRSWVETLPRPEDFKIL